jgi:hypothetical protein
MAVAPERVDKLAPILEDVARAFGRQGIRSGAVQGAKAGLRVVLEEEVRRIVQVYWTPFQATIPGRSIGLHLEVAEPRVHWCEAYLSPTYRNWVMAFHEREDGDIQLAYYRDVATYQEALDQFIAISGWYVLTATNTDWSDVVHQVDDRLTWPEHLDTLAGEATGAAITESLKKSTIMWLRFKLPDGSERTMPVWFVFDQKVNKIWVLSGERQQAIPYAELLREVDVILRWKGKNSSVAEIPAWVNVIRGEDPEWTEIADKVAEKRLNIPGLPEDTAKRWREECVILELTLRP